MFKNYLKTSWRNLRKNKMHSFINIAGLAGGMAVAILIGLWIYDEVSFDKNFKNHDRIARVIQNVTNNGEVMTWNSVPYPLADELRKSYGGDFKHVVMGAGAGDHVLSIEDKKLTKSGIYFEKGFIEMFSLKMLKGNRNSLDDPSSVILSSSAANAYFGEVDPVNKIMKIDNEFDVKVTGVYEDFPTNSAFAGFQFISTWDQLDKILRQ